MEFRISRENLLNGVQKVQGIVETKGTMPILSHLLLSAEDKGICIQATDLEIGSKGLYPANVIAKGSVALNARKLFDIVKELPEQEIHIAREENDWITMKCGNSKFRLPGLPSADFPMFPEYSEDNLMEFRAPLLKEMIRKTIFAISPDESRQALNGLLLEREGGRASMVGTDGHRLALIHRPVLKPVAPDGDIVMLTESSVPRLRIEEPLRFGKVLIATGNQVVSFPGSYGIWLKRAGTGWRLVFNNEPDAWGSQHDPKFDAAEIELSHSDGHVAARPFAVALVPNAPDRGRLVIIWGPHEWTADFVVPS